MADETCSCLTNDGNWGDNLVIASEKGHDECVEKLTFRVHIRHVKEKIKGVSEKRQFIDKAILAASRRGHCSIVETLISVGGNVNCLDYEKQTPLAIAANKGFTNTVKKLINLGADIDCSDRNGWNALTHATTGGHYDTVKVLLANHANVNFVGLRRDTALTLAASRGNTDLVILLLKYKADIHHLAAFGNALACASKFRGNPETVEVLLQAGSCVNSTNPSDSTLLKGQTPLMLAAEHKHIEVMKVLLAWGANIDQEDKNKRTPLHHAAHLPESHEWEVGERNDNRIRHPSVKFLLQSGANIRKRRNKQRLLDLALTRYRRVFSSYSPQFKITEELTEDGGQIVGFLYTAGADISEEKKKDKKYAKILPKFIADDLKPTLELPSMCRKRIRKHLLSRVGGNHKNLIPAVHKLPLPEKLKEYILFDINI